MNLASVDLNLLLAFNALMEEQSVTRGGRKIGLSQPAMSGALNRLRAILDDELFVRRGVKMVPTPRALEIEAPIRQALQQIQSTLAPKGFVPAQAQQVFRIAADDLSAAIILPGLAEQLSRIAPRVSIEVSNENEEQSLELVDSQRADFAMGTYSANLSKYESQQLFSAPCVCAMRAGHPLAGRKLSLEAFAEAPHLVVREEDLDVVDDLIAERGLQRRIALAVTDVLVAPFILARTDLIAVLPLRLVQRFQSMIDLRTAEIPFEVNISRMLVWHHSRANNAANMWLQTVILKIAKDYAERLEKITAR